uniref:Uncharacterized protein n=1 Tax=Ciona intestinalis TaxID=7719 RepID=H2XWJ6_CIOIN
MMGSLQLIRKCSAILEFTANYFIYFPPLYKGWCGSTYLWSVQNKSQLRSSKLIYFLAECSMVWILLFVM